MILVPARYNLMRYYGGGIVPPSGASGGQLARLFNGTSDYIDCGTPIAPAGDFTWTAWIYLTSLSANAVIITQGDVGGGSGNWQYIQFLGAISGNLRATVDGSSSFVNGSTILSANTWYHVALTYTTGTQKTAIYINGALDATLPGTTVPVFSSNNDLTIGAAVQHTGNFWPGLITDIAMFNVLLNGTQLSNLAAGQRANSVGATASLQRYYPILGQSPEPDTCNGFNGVLTGTTVGTGPPTLQPYWSGPVLGNTHRWQMDSASISGGAVTDVGGLLNATIVGAPTNVSSPPGAFVSTGLSFDGVNDQLNLASNPIVLGSSDNTIAFWINLPNISQQPGEGGDPRLFDFGSAGNWFTLANLASTLPAGQLDWSTNYGPGGADYNGALSNNTWVHLAVSLQSAAHGQAFTLYVNGSAVTQIGSPSDTGDGTNSRIACRGDNLRRTKGIFYQFVTYNRVLSAGEVTALYNAK